MKVNRYALKDFMENEGLRPTDLADRSGVSKGFLSELLSGTKTEASPATLKKLADVIGCRVRALAQNPDDADFDVDETDPAPARAASKSKASPAAVTRARKTARVSK